MDKGRDLSQILGRAQHDLVGRLSEQKIGLQALKLTLASSSKSDQELLDLLEEGACFLEHYQEGFLRYLRVGEPQKKRHPWSSLAVKLEALLFKNKGVELAVEQGMSPFEIECDSMHLVWVFEALLENALKSGAQRVVAGWQREEEQIVIFVEENGSKEPFEPERAVELPRSSSWGGSGWGLAIVEHFSQQHRADLVFCAPQRCHQGSRVELRLPVF